MKSHPIALKTFLSVLFGIISFGALVAYAAHWFDPSTTPPLWTVGSPIRSTNPGPVTGQVKRGGIEVNRDEASTNGLIIEGNPITGEGIVNISSTDILTHFEQLQVEGNMRISGTIKPNGNQGAPDETLVRTSTGMDWNGREWMTVMGNFSPGLGCNGAAPLPCDSFQNQNGVSLYEDYELYCLGDANNYAALVRVCRKK